MTDIYTQFDKATVSLTAAALVLDGEAVGRVVVKYGAAATAYVQVWGAAMAKGRATGYGYDKTTAAIADAVRHLILASVSAGDTQAHDAMTRVLSAFADGGAGGERWDTRLRAAGFTVCNVI